MAKSLGIRMTVSCKTLLSGYNTWFHTKCCQTKRRRAVKHEHTSIGVEIILSQYYQVSHTQACVLNTKDIAQGSQHTVDYPIE